MIIDAYKNEINAAIKTCEQIKELPISSINIYGSSNFEDLFRDKSSDIDIIVMSSNFDTADLKKIVMQLNELNLDFKEKRPTILKDGLCERIEYY